MNELCADVKIILCEALKVDQARITFNWMFCLIRQLQFEMYLDQNTRYQAGCSPVTGKDVLNRMTPAAEFQSTDRQVEYFPGCKIAIRESHYTMNSRANPWMLSFNPEVSFLSGHAGLLSCL